MTKQIPIEKIDRGTNIREEQDGEIVELAESIKQNGLLNPITVVQKGSRFVVVAGHRRFLALKILCEPWVECNVLDYEPSERELLCIQLQENCCRKNMSAWEYADLFKKLMARGMKTRDLARICGKSEAWVSMQIMADRLLEQKENVTEETKKMSVHQVRKMYGSINSGVKNRKPKEKQAVILTHNSNVYSVRVNNKEAEKELVEILEKFKAKWIKMTIKAEDTPTF